MPSCPDLNDPDTVWSFCPSFGASILFVILFGTTTCVHFYQAISSRKAYCWVIVMSGIWQIANFVFRSLSMKQPANETWYSLWFILTAVAPLWTNAFVYMVMGRMIWNYQQGARIWHIKAWNLTIIFVILDISVFVVQVLGVIVASGRDKPSSTVLRGLHIYMLGTGLQELFILVFSGLSFTFCKSLRGKAAGRMSPQGFVLLYTLWSVLGLITVRIIFRLCEYSQGLDSKIPNHEAYGYCLDSLPMWVALVLLNIVHPGRVMTGQGSDMPSRKERRVLKNQIEPQYIPLVA